jgi:hypothetical protein
MINSTGWRSVVAFVVTIAFCASAAHAGLIHRYSFADGKATDSVGKVDGKLKGAGASIADGKLTLKNADKGSGDDGVSYVDFGSSILPKGKSVSLVIWFTSHDNTAYARLLNIGDKDGAVGAAFIYFTARNAEDKSRAAISATDTASKTFIDGANLDDGKPHVVAFVVDGTAKKLHVFVDGKEPVPAADLGDNTLDKVRPVNNWIGRSSFDQDPGLSATIEEFRVYDEALTLEQAAGIVKAGKGVVGP